MRFDKVVINGDFLTYKNIGGVGRYGMGIISELDKLIDNCNFEILVPEYCDKLLNLRHIRTVKYGKKEILKWKHSSLPSYVKKKKALLVDLTQAFPLSVRGVTCVHDCIPEIVDDAYSGVIGKYLRRPIKLLQRRYIIKRSRAVITVSETSKLDLIRIYNVSSDKITVVPNGWQHVLDFIEDDSINKKFKLNDKSYYFTLGSRVPQKNIRWIIANAQKNPKDVFVVSGDNSYDKKFNNRVFPKNVIFTGYISDGQIKSLMSHCKAFILPSIYEGFGIPPLEALALGCRIIVSNTSCLPEVYGDSAHYINPYDYSGIDLDRLLQDPVENSEQILEKYSYEKSASILYSVIYKILRE